jgi:hypothetical protein
MNRSSVGRLVGSWSYDLRSVTEVAIMVVDPLGQVVEPALPCGDIGIVHVHGLDDP